MQDRHDTDDTLDLIDDDGPAPAPSDGWSVLVVDDDEDVHDATRFALQGLRVLDRPLRLSHARSASEARAILEREHDVAVILLDVVMESERAGLDLVREIRGPLGITDTRIILRTGQPGYAPEISTIRDYDVNDYKTKSELTHARLYATLTTSVRSYSQLRTITASRRGLAAVVRATSELLGARTVEALAEGVLAHASLIFDASPDAVVCELREHSPPRVLCARGRYAGAGATLDPAATDAMLDAVRARQSRYEAGQVVLHFGVAGGPSLCALLACRRAPDELARHLLDVLASNVTVLFNNLALVSLLRERAHTDPLCGIRNRAGLVAAVDEAIAAPQSRATLALVDIDQFAEINDALGHRYGDRLLQAFARRLRDAMPAPAVVARVASDVFGVLAPERALSAESLRGILAEPFEVEPDRVELAATMGFVRLAEVDGDGSDALKEASIALKRAKHRRDEGDCFFTRTFATEIEERVSLLRALRGAKDRGELFLVFQPQVAIDTGRVIGFEALLRWNSPERGFVPPDRFIPIAERSGLIVPIGAWVLEESARMLRRLDEQGFEGLRMSANVALSQFRHPGFLAALDRAAEVSGAPERFELEITESMAMDDTAMLADRLESVKQRGCTIAIDDFGTGFSSLSHLHRLPVDRLKIDRAFVSALSDARGGSRIADTVVKLGAGLGLSVIAEGIETEPQRAALEAMGCHEGQGWLFARPMPADALLAWLQARAGTEA